jgi:hypothetical protein
MEIIIPEEEDELDNKIVDNVALMKILFGN